MTPVVAIVGLGLIGGSLARDLTAAGCTVLGYDVDPGTRRAAHEAGVIAGLLGMELEDIEAADILVLATPPLEALSLLDAAAPRLGGLCLVTDVGSVKQSIVAAAERLGLGGNFVGAHPLAGDHRAGWSAARSGLFHGARVFLTPNATSSSAALAAARSLWDRVGARTEELDAAAHDRLVAWTSHLPQALSSTLAIALAGEHLGPGELGPGGRDMTRLAASSPGLWTEIALANAEALGPALHAVEVRLRHLRAALEAGDQGAVRAHFEAGQQWTSASLATASPGGTGGFPPRP